MSEIKKAIKSENYKWRDSSILEFATNLSIAVSNAIGYKRTNSKDSHTDRRKVVND